MKLKGLALLSVFQLSAHAGVVANLRETPMTFTVAGKDSDATRLFDSIAGKPDANQTKKLISEDQNFSIECKKEKKDANCLITLYPSLDVEVHVDKDYAYYSVVNFNGNDNRANFIFQQLTRNQQGRFPMYYTDKQDLAFSSSDKRFVFSYRKVGSKWRLGWPFNR